MILCCGEALIDFLPTRDTEGRNAFVPFNGGSIYNVAIALGRLKVATGYFGGLSTDFFGERLHQSLIDSGVDLSHTVFSKRSSTLAFVTFKEGEPSYAFVDECSAARMIGTDDLPTLPDEVGALHFGSISLIHDPAGACLETLATREAKKRLISLDPNIRAGQISDRTTYLRRLETMIDLADIIKLSDEDLQWLAADGTINETTMDEQMQNWLSRGARLVVITRGAKGASAWFGDERLDCAPGPVEVADTIGAGDTFMAALLAFLHDRELLTKDSLASLDAQLVRNALTFAAHAAAICVSRPGADPPWRHELEG